MELALLISCHNVAFFWLAEAWPGYCAESGVWGRPPATAVGPAVLFAEAAEEMDGRKGRAESLNACVLLKAGTLFNAEA